MDRERGTGDRARYRDINAIHLATKEDRNRETGQELRDA